MNEFIVTNEPLGDVATRVLQEMVKLDPNSRLTTRVSVVDAAALAAYVISTQSRSCPKCGSEPWVNIDCDLCQVCAALE